MRKRRSLWFLGHLEPQGPCLACAVWLGLVCQGEEALPLIHTEAPLLPSVQVLGRRLHAVLCESFQDRSLEGRGEKACFFFKKNYFWPCWIFVAEGVLSLLVASKGLLPCGALALRCLASVMWPAGLVALQHVGSSWTKGQTCDPCISGPILNHWTTREVRKLASAKS